MFSNSFVRIWKIEKINHDGLKTLILIFYVYIEMVYMERILFNEDASEETS